MQIEALVAGLSVLGIVTAALMALVIELNGGDRD